MAVGGWRVAVARGRQPRGKLRLITATLEQWVIEKILTYPGLLGAHADESIDLVVMHQGGHRTFSVSRLIGRIGNH